MGFAQSKIDVNDNYKNENNTLTEMNTELTDENRIFFKVGTRYNHPHLKVNVDLTNTTVSENDEGYLAELAKLLEHRNAPHYSNEEPHMIKISQPTKSLSTKSLFFDKSDMANLLGDTSDDIKGPLFNKDTNNYKLIMGDSTGYDKKSFNLKGGAKKNKKKENEDSSSDHSSSTSSVSSISSDSNDDDSSSPHTGHNYSSEDKNTKQKHDNPVKSNNNNKSKEKSESSEHDDSSSISSSPKQKTKYIKTPDGKYKQMKGKHKHDDNDYLQQSISVNTSDINMLSDY